MKNAGCGNPMRGEVWRRCKNLLGGRTVRVMRVGARQRCQAVLANRPALRSLCKSSIQGLYPGKYDFMGAEEFWQKLKFYSILWTLCLTIQALKNMCFTLHCHINLAWFNGNAPSLNHKKRGLN